MYTSGTTGKPKGVCVPQKGVSRLVINTNYIDILPGDICRFREDGNLEFLGRIDDQVNIRGYRIELGEVQSNLKVIDGVCDSCVLVKHDRKGDKELIAYVVLNAGVTHSPNTLKSAMKKRVPDFMVPSAYVMLTTFPKTENGKTDKRALPTPHPSDYEHQENVEPTNEIECQVKANCA